MNWQSPAIRDASRGGDHGRVIELVRKEARMTQKQLGEACGLSQSAVSRLEKRGTGSYSTDTLASIAAHLGIPVRMVGLAEQSTVRNGFEQVERRAFLGGVAATAASPILGAVPNVDVTGHQAAALRLNTATYRRLDSSTPSRDLAEAVHAHIRLIQNVTRDAGEDGHRPRLAAVGSEAASLAAWLAWDMGDHGNTVAFTSVSGLRVRVRRT